MALIVTIGSATADSYASVTDLDAYSLNNLATDISATTTATKEAWLRRATQYLDLNFVWIGSRVDNVQILDWPRATQKLVNGQQVLSTTIPEAVKNAQMEIALKIKASVDFFNSTEIGLLKSETSTAGPVSISKTYVGQLEVPRVASVYHMLKDYVLGGPNQIEKIRG